MPRVILFTLLIYAFYWLTKRFLRFIAQKSGGAQAKNQTHSEKMVLCARCNTHIPASDAVVENQQPVCKNQPCG